MTRRRMLLGAFAARGEWKSLFDGRTAEGWLEVTGSEFPAGTWRITDGCLQSIKVAEGGFQDIRTKDVFTDFDFEFEWRIETGGNSGVKYLIDRVNRWAAAGGTVHARGRGAEYQIADDFTNRDAAGNPLKQCSALYDRIAPSVKATLPAGEFNRSRIVVAGGRVEHWLNGQKTVEYAVASRPSPIVLQHHNSAAWFRNLRIRGL